MTSADIVAIAARFATGSAPVDALPVLHGHIHETFIVTCAVTDPAARAERIVLHKLNRAVFADVDAVVTNHERIAAHLRRRATQRGPRSIVADPVAARAGGWLSIDERGAPWRATRFVEGARVLTFDSPVNDLRAAARAFAELTRDLDDLGPPALAETIPRFHDLGRRRADLLRATAADRAGRSGSADELIDRANRLCDAVVHELARSGSRSLPSRIVHNDAKLDNVLVDTTTGAVAGIVDLDTVMAGTVLNDFGELARTASSTAAEDEPDPSVIALDHERFAALAEGYLRGGRPFLIESELACLALGGPLLTLENAVRFLTDHLDGDVYFRVHRPEHNAQRARAHLRLAELMLEQLDHLRDTITAVWQGLASESTPA